MMIPRVFILSATSLALLLLAACLFPRAEAIKLRSSNNRAHVRALKPMKKIEPPSTTSTSAGGTTAMRVGRRHRGLGVTSTTTATTTSITTTTTMMAEDDEMSPSEFYMLHHRDHGLALAEEAAAAAAEENYYEESDPRQWRRRRRRRRRELVEVAERQRERPHLHDDQQQEQDETSPPEEEEVDEAESEQLEDEEESGQVEQQPIGGAVESASPTDDDDGDGTDDDNASVIAGPPFSPPSSNPDLAVDGSDVADDCDVYDREWLGDGWCYDYEPYNSAECGWDGGDCCYQTCRDGSSRCGDNGYVCRDPRFSDIVYDEEGERDPQRRRERQALKALHDATNGDGWYREYYDQGRWLNDTIDHCYWDRRIHCTGGEGYVWVISLNENNLNGTLPTEIGDLVHLETLSLYDNEHLSGTMPASIGNLTKLAYLGVSGTSLNGPVPANVMVPIFSTPREYYSRDNTADYAELSPDDCADMVGWTDADGHGCDWYSNDTSACATDGAQHGDVGQTADTACCACGLYATYDREREVLEELYGATNGERWHDNSFWNSSTSHCYYWTGVRCNSDGMVTNITLPSNNLHGSLPTSIGELRSLQILDVSNNDITGGIPTEVYTLTKLEGLHLRDVSLGGTVPTQIAALKLLRRLDLSHNGLDGPIPVDITDMSLVEDLRLSHNELTGTISQEFRRMSRLKRLDLNNNKLEGSIPVDLGLLGLLRELRISNQLYRDSNLDWHALRGPIPVELGDCQYLEVLDLSDNLLTGVLPTELARLARMKSLLLHNNKFEGYIPSEYGLLPSLESLMLGVWWDEQKLKPAPLSLCFNEAFDLHSDPSWCPPERNALKRLYDATGGDGWSNGANWTDPYSDHCSWYGVGCDVRVSCRDVQTWTDRDGDGCGWYDPDNCKTHGDSYENNNHSANTACCVCQQEMYGCSMNGTVCVKDYVTSLSLNSNGLSGSLPTELGQLAHLERLHLADNALVGGLPSDIANLTKLHLLNLTGNALSGGFPEEIASLPSLTNVSLSRNELSGEFLIPANNNASNLTVLHFANNKFDGEISAAFDQLRNFPYLREIDMSYNSFHGSIPSTPMDGITKLTVGGNERMTAPIPSALCHNQTLHLDLDLQNSPVHCPVLSFLRLFYNSTNGASWHTKWNWKNLASVCNEASWHGIICDQSKTSIIEINLANNGLAGTLPDSFGEHMSALSYLRVLDLGNNHLSGPIPVDLTRLSLLEEVRLANNSFSGTLLAQISNLPRLKILDVAANQLTGTLPIEFGRLNSLRELRLSGNRRNRIDILTQSDKPNGLRGEIPVDWGDLVNVEHMDLSRNSLTGEIPGALGKLSQLAQLYLHDNFLKGFIPTDFGQLHALKNLTLRRNENLTKPAPLGICTNSATSFDLGKEQDWCPSTRNSLKRLYDSTKGNSWTVQGSGDSSWIHEYSDYCQWHGVDCEPNQSFGEVSRLHLISNSLSGTIPADLFRTLTSLQSLVLGDNMLGGNISTHIGKLTKLATLHLGGNELSGVVPEEIRNLSNLFRVRLHDNRFAGGLSNVQRGAFVEPSKWEFIADCGNPYDWNDTLACNECTICCNSLGVCHDVSRKHVIEVSDQAQWMTWTLAISAIFISAAFLLLCSFSAIAYLFRNYLPEVPPLRRNVRHLCGEGSVYSFLLTDFPAGWFTAIATIVVQSLVFLLFLHAADFGNEGSDVRYTKRCPPNKSMDECESEDTRSALGWIVFSFVVFVKIAPDIINGFTLTYLSGIWSNIRCFCSSIVLVLVSLLAIWTSVFYNLAIATTDTELIINAVILLFVNEADEMLFILLKALLPKWTQDVIMETEDYSARLSSEHISNDEEDEAWGPCTIDLLRLIVKQNKTNEELRAQIKELKTAFEQRISEERKTNPSKNRESNSEDQ